MDAYHHKVKPTLYAYRKGCRCVGCRKLNADHQAEYVAKKRATKEAGREAVLKAAPKVGPIEASVRAGFKNLVDQPWLVTWKLLAIQHARTMDTIAVTGQNHLAGTTHAKLTECLDRLRPPTPTTGQAVKQGLSDAEAFANDL